MLLHSVTSLISGLFLGAGLEFPKSSSADRKILTEGRTAISDSCALLQRLGLSSRTAGQGASVVRIYEE